MMMQRLMRTAALASLMLSLAACPGPVPTQPGADGDEPDTPVTEQADGTPLAFTRVNEQDEAAYSDIAVGTDGTLHALYQERSKQSQREQVYYRASRDGGRSWSPVVNLLEGDAESKAGFIRIAVDGAGRVYAFWKTFAGFDIVDPSGGSAGSLVYRVLEAGAWSPALVVGTRDQVISWFPAVAPDGKLHLVWNEASRLPDGDFAPEWQGGLIRQAALEGRTMLAVRDLYKAPLVQLGSSTVYYSDGYRGLSGYIDAAGTPHFSALKASATQNGTATDPEQLVYFSGASEKPLLPVSELVAVLKPIRLNPPQLLRDAQGREHLLVLNQSLDRPALQDLDPAKPSQRSTVYQLGHANGDIRGFRAVQGPEGQLAALLSLHDTGKADARHDFWVARLGQAAWQPALNLTDNEARASFDSTQTSGSTSFSRLTAYSSRFGAGAFDAEGGLNLLFVNTEIVTIMRETDSGSGGDWAGASNSTTNVYFHRLP